MERSNPFTADLQLAPNGQYYQASADGWAPCDTETLNHTPVSLGLGELGVVAFVGAGLND